MGHYDSRTILDSCSKKIMGYWIGIIKNPQIWVTSASLAVLFFILKYFQEHLKADYAAMKSDNHSTRLQLKDHSKQMIEINTTVIFLKLELMKEVESIMVHISKIERNMEMINHSIELKLEKFEKMPDFISSLKSNLEGIYGKLTVLDRASDKFLLMADTHQKILQSHNQSIKELKGKK